MKRRLYPDYVNCDVCGYLKYCRLDKAKRRFICQACEKKEVNNGYR